MGLFTTVWALTRRVLHAGRRVVVPAAAAFSAIFAATMLVLIPYAQAMGPRVVARINEDPNRTSLVAMLGLAALPIFVAIFIGAIVWAGITGFVADGVSQDRPTSLVSAAGASLRRLPRVTVVLVAWLLSGITAIALTPAFVLVGLIGLAATPVARRTQLAERWPSPRTLAVLAVPFAAAIAMAVRAAFAAPAALLDGLGVRAALRRGWESTRGSIVGPTLVLLLAACISLGANALTIWLTASFDGPSGVRVALQMVVQLLVSPLLIVALVVLYRVESPPSPTSDELDLRPMSGSRTRQVATVSAAALLLQLVVLTPPQGTTIAAAPEPAPPTTVPIEADVVAAPLVVAAPIAAPLVALLPVDVNTSTSQPSPFPAGTPITVYGSAWLVPDPAFPTEGGGPTGLLTIDVDGSEVARTNLTGFLGDDIIGTPVNFTAGTHTITTTYAGDAFYESGTASITVIAGFESTTTVTGPTTPIVYGNDITIVADVASTNGTPTGVVRFDGLPGGPTDVVLAGGRAEITSSQLPPGMTTIFADYNPGSIGGSHLPSFASTTVDVREAMTTTELSTAPVSPSAAGANVTATVTVTAAGTAANAAGSITVYDILAGVPGASIIASGTLTGGTAGFDLSLAPGRHDLQVVFTPEPGFGASSTTTPHTVSKFVPTVGLTASSATSVVGEPLTLTAQVPAIAGLVPSGDVDFFLLTGGVAGASLATGTLGPTGEITVTMPRIALGDHEFVAEYSGDVNYTAVTSARLPHTVSLANVALSTTTFPANPVVGSPINVTISATPEVPGTGALRGRVTLMANGVAVTSTGFTGERTFFTFTPGAAGPVELTASYSGDVDFAATTDITNITVSRRPVDLVVFDPVSLEVTYGDTVRLDGVVSSGITTKPRGTVSFTANGVPLGQTPLDTTGRFVFATDLIQVGATIELVVSYTGDTDFEPATNRLTPVRIRVTKASANPVTTTNAASPTVGDLITLTVDLDDIGAGPSGTVTFSTPAGQIGTANVANGAATLDVTLTDTSTFFTASYSGDANFVQQDAAPLRIDAVRATPTIAFADPGILHYGDTVSIAVDVVTPIVVTRSGTVDLRTSSGVLLQARLPIVNGVATSTALCVGDDRICPVGQPRLPLDTTGLTATFSGTSAIGSGTAALAVSIAPAATTMTLTTNTATPQIGNRLVVTATVESTTSTAKPFGRVMFQSRAWGTSIVTALGTTNVVDGVAVLELDVTSTNLGYPRDTIWAEFIAPSGTFEIVDATTAVSLDRRSVEITPDVRFGTAVVGFRTPVTVSIRATEPGRPERFGGLVTVEADNGTTCLAAFFGTNTTTQCFIAWETAGTHTVTASYAGDVAHEPATSTPAALNVDLRQSSTQAVSAPANVLADTTFDITWNFAPDATGTITVVGQPGCDNVPLSAGRCAARLGRNEIGRSDTLLRVRYSGDARWLGHEFERPIQVGGCYAIEVLSANPRGGTVRNDSPTNCRTDLGTGYLAGTEVTVVATPIDPSEFVRWRSRIEVAATPAATFTITDDFDTWLLYADFQLACFPVSMLTQRGEPGFDTWQSEYGSILLAQSRNEENGASFDGRCELTTGGNGFEVGTSLLYYVYPEYNPWYLERDQLYGFSGLPGTATTTPLDGRSGEVRFTVGGPVDAVAVFGPRCRSVALSVDPPDAGATASILTQENCASPFGDGFKAHIYDPAVTVEVGNSNAELFSAGWFVNGTEVVDAGDKARARFDLAPGDLDIVARFVSCQTLTLSVDGATTPIRLNDDGQGTSWAGDLTWGTPVGELTALDPANCPDGTNRYITDSTVGLQATVIEPEAEFTGWSDNVTPSVADQLQASVVIAADDTTATASFFLESVCSRLSIDDPGGHLELGDTGCGDGYYLDQGKVWTDVVREELAVERSSFADYRGDTEAYERAVENVRTRRGTQLPLTPVKDLDVPGLYADAQTRGGYFSDCFPMRCSGPVSGALYVTASICQNIQPSFTIRIKDDPNNVLYGADRVALTTLAFNSRGVASEQPLRPWLETTDLSDPVLKYDANGNFTGYEYLACESFDNTYPDGTRVAARAGVSLPGLYLESWTGGTPFLPVMSEFGFEYQADVTTTSTPVKTISANLVAECKVVVLGVAVTVEPAPNCPDGSGRYIVGTALSVSAPRYLGRPTRVESSTKEWYQFKSGIIDASLTRVIDEESGNAVDDYYSALAFVDDHLTIEASYKSKVDEQVSTAIRFTKFAAGVILAAAPIILTTFLCPVCGAVLGALAAASFLVDLIPGTGGKATAIFNLINPSTIFSCGSKWATNTPTPGADQPPPDGSPPATVSDKLAIEFEARIIELIEFGEDTTLTDPDAIALRNEMLKQALDSLVPPKDGGATVDLPAYDKDDATYAAAAAKVLNTLRKEYPTAKAFVSGFGATSVLGITERFKDGVRAAKETERWTKIRGNGFPDAKAQFMAAATFAVNLNEAGYFDMDGLERSNGGYQGADEVAGLDTFTDCLKGKVGAITG